LKKIKLKSANKLIFYFKRDKDYQRMAEFKKFDKIGFFNEKTRKLLKNYEKFDF
jgi:hypothetical protein